MKSMVCGLTGGIAVGKSTVSRTFRSNNIPVIDADIVARQVVEPGTEGLDKIINVFGKLYLQNDGTLNRTMLGQLVFSNTQAMSALNNIMRALIDTESQSQIKQLCDAGNPIVVFDAALICENGNADKYRPLIVVSCPQKMQLARLMSRNNLTEQEAMNRINAQFSSEQREALADLIIDSSMSIAHSVFQTEAIISHLNKLYEITYKDPIKEIV